MMKTGKNILLLCFVIVGATFALAHDAAAAESNTVSTGTLVAAALETAGYKQMEIILRDLMGMIQGMGALIYLCVAVIALGMTAVGGSYRAAIWLLMGVPMFYLLLNSLTQSAGADWQFGAKLEDREGKVADYLQEANVTANVPFVFHEYNKLVSSTVQTLVGIVIDEQHSQEQKFLVRAQMLDGMLRTSISNGDLTALIRFTFSQCTDVFQCGTEKAKGDVEPVYAQTPTYRNATAIYEQRLEEPSISIAGTENYDYLKSLFEGLPSCLAQRSDGMYEDCGGVAESVNDADNPARPFFTCLGKYAYDGDSSGAGTRVSRNDEFLDQPLSCAALWCMVGVGIGNEVQPKRKDRADTVLSEEAKKNPDVLAEIYEDIRDKIVPEDQAPTPPDAKNHTLAQNIWDIQHIIGGHLARKTLINDTRSKALEKFAEHLELEPTPGDHLKEMSKAQLEALARKQNSAQLAEAEKQSVFVFAMLLPYIQGIILYALAVAFPFFCLLVLIPGKANSMLMWFALWAWVKSWDVGYALVMRADDVLWQLLPHTPLGTPPTDFTPSGVLSNVFSGDPAYALSTYYLLVGTMLSAVPLITAQLVLKGKAAMAGVMIEGIKTLGSNLGGSAADYVAVRQTVDADYAREYLGYKYTMQNLGKLGKTPEMQQFNRMWSQAWDRAQEIEDMGKGLQMKAAAGLAAAGGAGALAAGGVGAAIAGGVAGAKGTVALAGATVSLNEAQRIGLQLQRNAVRAKKVLLEANAAMHSYEYGNESEFYTQNALRAVESFRKYWWGTMQEPGQSETTIPMVMRDLEQETQRLIGKRNSNAAVGATDIAGSLAGR